MNPNKTTDLEAWKPPVNKTEVQSFLGLINHSRIFNKNYSRIAKPLSERSKNKFFVWSYEEGKSFSKPIKELT